MATMRRRLTGGELPKWLIYPAFFLWFVLLLAWLFATLIAVTGNDFHMDNRSPDRPGHYELQPR